MHVKACREQGEEQAHRGMIQERRKQRVKNIHVGKEVVERKRAKEAGMGPANQIHVTLTSVSNEGDLIDTKSQCAS